MTHKNPRLLREYQVLHARPRKTLVFKCESSDSSDGDNTDLPGIHSIQPCESVIQSQATSTITRQQGTSFDTASEKQHRNQEYYDNIADLPILMRLKTGIQTLYAAKCMATGKCR